jgi:hypothetical protein
MFDPNGIIDGLARDREVFQRLLAGRTRAEQIWRPAPAKWSRLEIVCHLRDEERDDFRTRVRHTLAGKEGVPPPADPEGWVTSRNYAAQDYEVTLAAFLAEREASVQWLRGLESPCWDSAFRHPKFGPMSARLFLVNWLAHDALHLRQLVRYDFLSLEREGGEDLSYAGTW